MSSSLHKRRAMRKQRRSAEPAKLNLVALMDIFTILVLFLMVNNGDVEILQSDQNVKLPESISEQKPQLALTIKISDENIIVLGRPIESIESALVAEGNSLPALEQELRYQASRGPERNEQEVENGRRVIIMGSSEMPYKLLKKIMASCAEADYRDISLAVNSQPVEDPLTDGELTIGGSS